MEREDKGRKHVPASVSFCNSVFFFSGQYLQVKNRSGGGRDRTKTRNFPSLMTFSIQGRLEEEVIFLPSH